MFGRDSGDTTVLCPFDNTHVILAKSFNSHLVKCRKNNQHLKKVPCKFDRTHMILKPELQHHHSVCPSRHLLNRELQVRAGVSNTLKGDVSGPEIQSAHVVDTEEDWDAAPRYTATNALFSSKKSYMEEEEDEEEFSFKSSTTNYDPSAAASSSSVSSSSSSSTGESFRRVPLAPSKAAQLSGPARPLGSSSQVYQYSVQQAVLGLGRGRGRPAPQGNFSTGAPTASVVRPSASISQAPVTSHLGRGIARFATQERRDVTPALLGLGRGVSSSRPAAVPTRPKAREEPRQQDDGLPTTPFQFEDSEDVQAQHGGTSSSVEAASGLAVGPSAVGGGEAPLSLEAEMEALLLREKMESVRELEQLRLQQERRHQQLLDLYRLKQSQQQQQQPPASQVGAGATSLSSAGPPPGFSSPATTEQRTMAARGRGRGPEQSALRVPNTHSVAQGLQTGVAVPDDDQLSLITTATEGSVGLKLTEREDFSQLPQQKLTRTKKKLEKKMKQILVLEKRVSDGETLSPEEEAKLRKKDGILKDLDKINQHL